MLLLAACGSREATFPTAPPVQPTAAVAETSPVVQPSPQAQPTDLPTEAPPTVTPTATPPAPLAAAVNGQYIFLAEYERRVAQFEQALLDQGVDPSTEDGRLTLAQMRQDVLNSMIEMVLIEQNSPALGVQVTGEELETQIEADIAAFGGEAAFQEWLAATGQTREDLEQMLRESLLTQRVIEAVTSDVGDTAEQVHARQIVVDNAATADEILAQLAQGADFAELARQHSLDEVTKETGGDLDWFPRGMIAAELEEAVFALQPGEYSEPIPIGEMHHILFVVERDAARPLTPDQKLFLQQDQFERWLAEQQMTAIVERFVEE
jgi:parvulin-like peptidyl-prolyl isomerase